MTSVTVEPAVEGERAGVLETIIAIVGGCIPDLAYPVCEDARLRQDISLSQIDLEAIERAIHLREALMMPASLVTSAVLCTAMLGEPVRAMTLDPEAGRDMWAWPVSDIAPVEPPFPARGRQGFWWVRLPARSGETQP